MQPILYVEDDDNDILLVRFSFQRIGVTAPLEVVTDGCQAIEYLSSCVTSPPERTLPCLLLLDLNLPVINGLEVLKWVRNNPELKELPVIIFSASDQPTDRARARELGADAYIVKPVNMRQIEPLMRSVKEQWLSRSGPDGSD